MRSRRRWVVACLALLLFGCTTSVAVRTDPYRADLYLNDVHIAERTPALVKLRKRAFARRSDRLRIEASGYVAEQIDLTQETNPDCVAQATTVAITGVFLVLPALIALAAMPYCVDAEEVDLVVLEPLVGPMPDRP